MTWIKATHENETAAFKSIANEGICGLRLFISDLERIRGDRTAKNRFPAWRQHLDRKQRWNGGEENRHWFGTVYLINGHAGRIHHYHVGGSSLSGPRRSE